MCMNIKEMNKPHVIMKTKVDIMTATNREYRHFLKSQLPENEKDNAKDFKLFFYPISLDYYIETIYNHVMDTKDFALCATLVAEFLENLYQGNISYVVCRKEAYDLLISDKAYPPKAIGDASKFLDKYNQYTPMAVIEGLSIYRGVNDKNPIKRENIKSFNETKGFKQGSIEMSEIVKVKEPNWFLTMIRNVLNKSIES